MSETLNKTKFYSGRFLLCICAAIAIVMLAFALSAILWTTRHQPQVNGAVLSGMTILSGVLSSIVTFYFTRQKQGEPK